VGNEIIVGPVRHVVEVLHTNEFIAPGTKILRVRLPAGVFEAAAY
jgi:hypothetical protein